MNYLLHNSIERKAGFFRYPMIFITGAVVAASGLFGEITPLASAFIGSLAGGDCLFAFMGMLCTFLLKGQMFEAMPLLSIMMIIGLFRFFLGGFSSRMLSLCSALLVGVSVGAVGIVSAAQPSDVIVSLVMAVTSGLLSYCLTVTYRSLAGGSMTVFSKISFSAIVAPSIVMVFAVAVLTNLSFEGGLSINIGVLFGTVMSLAFAKKYSYSGGSIGGILTASGVLISTPELSSGMVMFAVAATACTLFVKHGRITQTAGFIFVMGVGVSVIGLNSFTLSTMAGAAAGGILYIVFPVDVFVARINPCVANAANSANGVQSGADMSVIFAERLRLAGGALSDVKIAVEKAGEILDKRNTKDFSWVYNSTGDLICRKCKHNMVCWGEEYSDTVSGFNNLLKVLRKGEQLFEKDLPSKIIDRCGRKQQLLFALSERYREYTAINSANRKITEMRTVLTSQLSATESLMFDMSEEFLDYSYYDRVMAAKVEKVLSDNGISRPRVAVVVNEGRVTVEGYGKGKLDCEGSRLGDLLSEALQRQFDLPEIIHAADSSSFRFAMYEKAIYGITYGAYQLAKSNQRSCGDYYDSFVDGKGYAYIILSDGMGSGSRARVDSAFACGMLVKLLRAGIGLHSAMEIINNSLLVKSSDESFATLDICRIDLYTGKTELYKAGAASSYIRCNKRLVKAPGRGLPVGIGYKAVYETQSFVIGNSDMVIMASDGAELNEKWLEHHLAGKDSFDLNETAKVLAETARYSSVRDEETGGREDDISVIAVKLVR